MIRVAFDAWLRRGNYFIGGFARRDGVTIRAIQLRLRRAMAFVLEASEAGSRLDSRLSSTLWFWAGSSLLTRCLGCYQNSRRRALVGEENHRECSQDRQSNQTASDLAVERFALPHSRCPFSAERAILLAQPPQSCLLCGCTHDLKDQRYLTKTNQFFQAFLFRWETTPRTSPNGCFKVTISTVTRRKGPFAILAGGFLRSLKNQNTSGPGEGRPRRKRKGQHPYLSHKPLNPSVAANAHQ